MSSIDFLLKTENMDPPMNAKFDHNIYYAIYEKMYLDKDFLRKYCVDLDI